MNIVITVLDREIEDKINLDYVTLKHPTLNDIILEFDSIKYSKYKHKYFITLIYPKIVVHDKNGYVRDMPLSREILKQSVINEVSINNRTIKKRSITIKD